LHRLAAGQLVHSLLRDVEAVGGVVNGGDVDGVAVVRERVAFTAVGAVPAGDGEGAADARERRKAAGGAVALGHEAVGAVGARGREKVEARVVVLGVVGDSDGARCRWCRHGQDGQRSGQDGKSGGEEGELHFCFLRCVEDGLLL